MRATSWLVGAALPSAPGVGAASPMRRARARRTITFGEAGFEQFDPLIDGLIVGSLFARHVDGVWSWLDDTRDRTRCRH